MHSCPTVKLPNHLNNETPITLRDSRKDKVVVVVGATGAGKSRLSIDLATRFNGEVINSDKIQVYKGLDVIANKVAADERRGVPHHLLGFVDPDDDFTADDFVRHASLAAASIASRGRLPIVAGGSLSFVKALALGRAGACEFHFLWVDVAMRVLRTVLSRRVDKMVELGLVEEARGFYAPGGDYGRGIRRAVGVPELDEFFRTEAEGVADDGSREELLAAAIDEIKANTHELAYRQVEKIMRLPEDLGVELLRLDATTVFEANNEDAAEEWKKVVLEPSTKALSRFL
ncbi:adenylate isopentenyltransferase 5, chloroplastic-like [Salvia miltiorrhiza]|uniref:adenylate isopentenyltransferase 5, chloroplastic-like n=1 Tax=Salvia miltiorrhiza TaxID=226208 RepID=UPI0025ABBE87|nr:adenylate isopentenyltransferase 5, chloroplastic-like [Salvia miltiorrhiza]